VSSTLEAGDGIKSKTELHKQVLNTLAVKNNTQLVQAMLNASASEFAALAPLVIDLAKQDEPTALALMTDGVTYLDTLCQQTLLNTDLSLALVGGLAPVLEPWFSSAIRTRIVKAQGGPEWGAVRLLKTDFPLVSQG
jgi:glucosamine kinase